MPMIASCGMRARWLRIVEKTTAPMNVKRQADPVDRRRVRIAARERQQQRDRRAERRDLRQREVDEDDAALDDVHAEIGVDAGQDQAGDEGRRQELRACRVSMRLLRSASA